jgi:acetyl esterase/lipase
MAAAGTTAGTTAGGAVGAGGGSAHATVATTRPDKTIAARLIPRRYHARSRHRVAALASRLAAPRRDLRLRPRALARRAGDERRGAHGGEGASEEAGAAMIKALGQALWSLRGDPTIPVTTPTLAAVRYRDEARPGIPPLADVYLPPAATGASVVLVHGGAFVIGSRAMKPVRYLATRLAAAGVAVCAIDYRLIFRGGRLDDALADVADALAFWTARAPSHGLDPRRISLVGLSAGATLAILAAADAPGLHRLACGFGLYELDDLTGAIAASLPRLLLRTADRSTWRSRSPRHATQPTGPTLLLHGDADGLVPVAQARRLAAHREALALPTRLVVYPGAPHGFFSMDGAAAEAGVAELIAAPSRSDAAQAPGSRRAAAPGAAWNAAADHPSPAPPGPASRTRQSRRTAATRW